ncbi:hypothetical protein BDV36DRAFT_290251 [Aspergillus pseudocaelatus]|uniref:Uncharacterized protein n=1 Tax=Aspergillus pseudocaelatus TaxID=1825620 RepID=A0ABQ6X2L6_9EURO|nr:hypothetical protein BDV36DRAFT_290251 [Aspergillus pseudocaelatus]
MDFNPLLSLATLDQYIAYPVLIIFLAFHPNYPVTAKNMSHAAPVFLASWYCSPLLIGLPGATNVGRIQGSRRQWIRVHARRLTEGDLVVPSSTGHSQTALRMLSPDDAKT